MHLFSRSELLLKEDGLSILYDAHIAVFGIGGVGGNCVESLVRSGVGEISIFDHDHISITNLNRQIIALHSTLNQKKVEAMKQRLLDINPSLKIHVYDLFLDKDNIDSIDYSEFHYMVDAIDTVSSKLLLIEKAKQFSIPIISCMGTGNKLDPTQLKIMDISKTMYCPLAKVMRRELKRRNIYKVKVLSSYEKPLKPLTSDETTNKRQVPGSVSFVPSVAGIIISKEVILDLIT